MFTPLATPTRGSTDTSVWRVEIAAAGDEPMRAICCMPVEGQARLADGTTFPPPWSR